MSVSVERTLLEALGPIDTHSPASTSSSSSRKRTAASASLEDPKAADHATTTKPVKRRAAKACSACRMRKVRCDVMQRYHITANGTVTCSNCTMDGIECVVEQSKRRKKSFAGPQPAPAPLQAVPSGTTNLATQNWNGTVQPGDIHNEARRWSGSTAMSNDIGANDFTTTGHVPHSIYQNANQHLAREELLRRASHVPPIDPDIDLTYGLLSSASIHGDRKATRIETPLLKPQTQMSRHALPSYLKPLPQRMTPVDIEYLYAKGAISIPPRQIRNALLRAYVEYVHPFMPLIEVHEVLHIINEGTGASGRISLLLFQSIMFAGTAFVDMEYLRSAGFINRKAARKAFFQKARVLYDFDYEIDRVALVQSLLLMTYWYETPDDQKDTWHWMGVAISLAHTIGLHRNPASSNMSPSKKKLWKRIWWSCFMRDRLVALGMRRPTRVKDEDYDVPMLTEDDFEEPITDDINFLPHDSVMRDPVAQRELAQMCIAKAKLCLCISHVLSAQYSVLIRHQGMQNREGTTRSSVMLFPKKLDQITEVNTCDEELAQWIQELPAVCHYDSRLPSRNVASVFVQRALLNMVYHTTISALHRPQVLPSPTLTPSLSTLDLSRRKVRDASREITRISSDLHRLGLEKYLPTTGVTVLLPAIIIHLLDIKSANEDVCRAAIQGFGQCMAVLERLRDSYASADFATQFLEAATRKADIDLAALPKVPLPELPTPQPDPEHEPELEAHMELEMDLGGGGGSADEQQQQHQLDENFNPNDFLNFGSDLDWVVPVDEGAHGESGGFVGDMNWIEQVESWSRMASPVRDFA